jgi:flagellar basal-body rod protein FlgC
MDGIQRLFAGMRAASSGLSAERQRIDVIAKNLANAHTTRTEGGGPYRRELVLFEPLLRKDAQGAAQVAGVKVAGVVPDTGTPFEQVFDPGHPDADARGIVLLPNVNATREMADLITAMRAYEADIAMQESFVQMAERALRLAQ